MVNRRAFRLFGSRKGNLEYRAKRDYIRNGIATIPCRITDYYDVISSYSVKGFETLEPDFVDYVQSSAEVTPKDCPIVLNIVGDCLSGEEKETIENIIKDDFAYDLGIVEKKEKRHRNIIILMTPTFRDLQNLAYLQTIRHGGMRETGRRIFSCTVRTAVQRHSAVKPFGTAAHS